MIVMSAAQGSVTDPLNLGEAAVVLPGAPGATEAYTTLLGEPRAVSGAGFWPAGNGSVCVLTESEEATPGVAFAAADVAGAERLLARRGLPIAATVDDLRPGRWTETVPSVGIIPADGGAEQGRPSLDHVVFTAPTIDTAVALFAGRLGMDLRLIKPFGEGGQLFFRTSAVIVEVLAGLQPSEDVGLWGLAWDTTDIDQERERLIAAGLEVSEVRDGRKPGTRVATVREPALATPTILIESTPRR